LALADCCSLLCACGSSADSAQPSFRVQANAICREARKEITDAPERIELSPDERRRMDTALIRSAESTIRALGRLDPRPGQADVYGRWLGHLEDANRALEDILAAARGEARTAGPEGASSTRTPSRTGLR
jgi:hypothetical protein